MIYKLFKDKIDKLVEQKRPAFVVKIEERNHVPYVFVNKVYRVGERMQIYEYGDVVKIDDEEVLLENILANGVVESSSNEWSCIRLVYMANSKMPKMGALCKSCMNLY